MLKIERRTDKKPFNCNNCGATNYESEWNDTVDCLTHISTENGSGSYICMRLCDKCLKELKNKLKDIQTE